MSSVHTLPVQRTTRRLAPNAKQRSRVVLDVAITPAKETAIDRLSPLVSLVMAVSVSAILHFALGSGAYFASKNDKVSAPPEQEKLEVAVIEKIEPPPVEVKKVEPPKPEKPKPKIVDLAPPPLPETVEAPPPPNEEAPVDTPPTEIVAGISESSTSDTGSFNVGVGNTLYAVPDEVAKAPEEVKPYKAKEYSPFHLLSEAPVRLGGIDRSLMDKFYPTLARKAGIEKRVSLKIIVDDDGSVVKVTVVNDPGYGFADAAQKLAMFVRYKPAKINGRAVATEIPFTLDFKLL